MFPSWHRMVTIILTFCARVFIHFISWVLISPLCTISDLHSNHGSIFYCFEDTARYWSKIMIFPYPLHSSPPLQGEGDFRRDCRQTVWYGKTRMVGLHDGEKSSMMFSCFNTVHACDGRTNGWWDILEMARAALGLCHVAKTDFSEAFLCLLEYVGMNN